jgi:hypothetical protein
LQIKTHKFSLFYISNIFFFFTAKRTVQLLVEVMVVLHLHLFRA